MSVGARLNAAVDAAVASTGHDVAPSARPALSNRLSDTPVEELRKSVPLSLLLAVDGTKGFMPRTNAVLAATDRLPLRIKVWWEGGVEAEPVPVNQATNWRRALCPAVP